MRFTKLFVLSFICVLAFSHENIARPYSGNISSRYGSESDAIIFNGRNFATAKSDKNGRFCIDAELGDSLYFKGNHTRIGYCAVVANDYINLMTGSENAKPVNNIPSNFYEKLAAIYNTQRYEDCFRISQWFVSLFYPLTDTYSVGAALLGLFSGRALMIMQENKTINSRRDVYHLFDTISGICYNFFNEKSLSKIESANDAFYFTQVAKLAKQSFAFKIEYLEMYCIKDRPTENQLKKIIIKINNILDPILYDFKESDPFTTLEMMSISRSCKTIGNKNDIASNQVRLCQEEMRLIEYYLTDWKFENAQDMHPACYDFNLFYSHPLSFSQVGKTNLLEYANYVCSDLVSLYVNLASNKIKISERLILDFFLQKDRINEILKTDDKTIPLVTSKDIQDKMNDTDCVEYFTQGPSPARTSYLVGAINNNYYRYAFVFTKSSERIEFWSKGFYKKRKTNDNSNIEYEHPAIQRYFILNSEDLAYSDLAGTNDKIHLVTSPTDLIRRLEIKQNKINRISFFGDINYWAIGNINLDQFKGNGEHGALSGARDEINHISSLFGSVETTCGNDVKKHVLLYTLSQNRSVVHISTHGIDTRDGLVSAVDAFTGKDVMNNFKLLLSGYNDNPDGRENSLSGADIMKLRKSNVDLVFLDACDSGSGRYNISYTGLAYAFKSIGIKNVICYLEPVRDDIATQFSNEFYTQLSHGRSFHEAFFLAKKLICPNTKIVLWE